MPIEEKVKQLEQEITELRTILFKKTGSGANDIRVQDFKGTRIFKLEGTDGTLVIEFTADGNLLGFYGATAVNQPDAVADATTQSLTGSDTIDQTKLESDLDDHKTAINTIIDRLQELGLIK